MRVQVSRRAFLRDSMTAAVGAWAAPRLIPTQAWAGANQRLNIAMLACGGRAVQLVPSILASGENIVALCDVDARQIAHMKKLFADKLAGAKIYEDYRTLLDKEKTVDAVVISPGQRWHVPMCKRALEAGKHIFCEKPLAHSVAEARQIGQLVRQSKLVTQIGTQGGATDTFRRSIEVIQAGLLGRIQEVHCWINRGFPPSTRIDPNPDPIPEGLNWDFWCGPSPLLPFKQYYIAAPGQVGCLHWGRWLAFGDGHLADMGAHAMNLPWRALKLGPPTKVSVKSAEPVLDSYPSANSFCWECPSAEGHVVRLWWHDGHQAEPPEHLGKELLSTYGKVPTNGVLFVGEKGILYANAWGVGGVLKLQGDAKCRGVLDHEAAKPIPVSLPRTKDHMKEWLDACKGQGQTFQPLEIAAPIAEVALIGIVALRVGQSIQWDNAAMKVPGLPEADRWIHLEQRQKWL
ncbi:MAG: Gfo/Idh/MocA family oxidoreductase [Thermoguttaceae bacterium]|nr:Gfo/Idh/MocA family oxidoreductase [Thermoguttaceae bacterium]MDW8038749.1 Gfo/Idh/MocA family oxidoreductase [Thermoguttaceae bacterium]